jgi:hypothetical protein
MLLGTGVTNGNLRPDQTCAGRVANPSVEPETRATQDAARSLGVQLHILRASTAGEIDAAFASLAKLRARALVVSDDCYFLNQRAQVTACGRSLRPTDCKHRRKNQRHGA